MPRLSWQSMRLLSYPWLDTLPVSSRETEEDGEVISGSYPLAITRCRVPFGHQCDYAQGLIGKVLVPTAYYFGIAQAAIQFYHEAKDYTPLNAVIPTYCRILDVLCQPPGTGLIATGERSISLHYVIYPSALVGRKLESSSLGVTIDHKIRKHMTYVIRIYIHPISVHVEGVFVTFRNRFTGICRQPEANGEINACPNKPVSTFGGICPFGHMHYFIFARIPFGHRLDYTHSLL